MGLEALRIGTARGQPDTEMVFAVELWEVRRLQGRAAEMLPALSDAAAAAQHIALVRCALALAHADGWAAQTKVAGALLATETADGFARVPYDLAWSGVLCQFADIAAQVGDRNAARALYDLLSPWSDLVSGVHGCVTTGPIALHLGSLAATLDEPAAAETHFRHALALLDPARVPYWGARAQVGLARVLYGQGKPAEADELSCCARAIADKHSLGGLIPHLSGLRGPSTPGS